MVPGVLNKCYTYYQYAKARTGNVPVHTSDYKHQQNFDTPQGFQQIRLRYTVANVKQTIGSLHDWSVTVDYSIRACLDLRKLLKHILCASKWQGVANSGMVIVSYSGL